MTSPDLDHVDAALAGFDVPAARHPEFPTADVSFVVDDTPIGRMLLACTASGVLVASLFTPDAASEQSALERLATRISPRVLRAPRPLDGARRWLEGYLTGGKPTPAPAWTLALATPFQIPVLTTLAERVGYGDRATYGQLAGWSGRPRAARAVGTALGSNPLCVVLPCHRVVGASGSLTGYAGGLAAKRYLLDLESKARPDNFRGTEL